MLGNEQKCGLQASQPEMSKAELRKNNKPIMEKRRRARINQYLDELKTFILENEKDPTRHSKLEKADILEMTVKRIQVMQRQQLNTAVANDPAVLTKFRNGFSECATEVLRFVDRLENVEPVIKHRLMSHMNKCVNQLQQIAPFCGHHVPYMPERFPDVKVGFQNDFQNGDENNNGSARIQIPNGVKLIPSRLPTGELAFLVPQSAGISANFPFFPPAAESSARVGQLSAFTAVHRSHSPLLSPSTSTSSSTYGDESHHSEQPQRLMSPNQPHSSRAEPFKFGTSSAEAVSSKSSLSSSPETQKPQVSSSSDRSPIATCSESKVADDNAAATEKVATASDLVAYCHLRRPLSVITDKASNRTCDLPPNRKRCKVELLMSANDDQSVANDDPATTPRASDQNLDEFPTSPTAQGPFNANSDMWRPW